MWDNELMLQRNLADLSVTQLRTMLNEEVQKDVPDDDLVLAILHILEDRDPVAVEGESDQEKAAWSLFRKRIHARKKGRKQNTHNLMRVASIVLVFCLLFALVPQQAEADNWWQRLTKWTDDFFGFFREEEDTFQLEDYEFRTDNPGLQQVYDAVVELGVTIPAVPMWLPEGYELAECTTVETPVKQYVHARFLNNDKACVLKVHLLHTEGSKVYFKDEIPVQEHEKCGMKHNIIRNTETWSVTWTKDNIECFFSVDCTEDVLYEIIESIYRWRMNE